MGFNAGLAGEHDFLILSSHHPPPNNESGVRIICTLFRVRWPTM